MASGRRLEPGGGAAKGRPPAEIRPPIVNFSDSGRVDPYGSEPMTDSREIRLIAFRVGAESFVLDIMAVRQIVVYSGSRRIPKAPDFIEGITVLRNEVIPVIDLRSRFFPGLPGGEGQPFVLITNTKAGVLGLKVDEVTRILRVETAAILPPPPIIRGMQGELFIGVIKMEDDLYLVVDLDSILSSDEQRSLASVSLAPAGSAVHG